MKSRLLASLALFLTVVALMVFLIKSDEQKSTDEQALLSSVGANSIDSVLIHRVGGTDIAFAKKQGVWFIISPLQARANTTRIKAILGILSSRSFTQIDIPDSELGLYQLDPPAVTLRLQEHVIQFGTTDPLDDRRYVRFENKIHLINDQLFHQLKQMPMFFVSPELIPQTETISSIQFGDRLVTKIGDHWRMSPPGHAVPDEQLRVLAEAWQAARARQVRRYSHNGEGQIIIVTFESGRSAGFELVSVVPDLVLGRADLAFEYRFDKNMAKALFPPPGKNQLTLPSTPDINTLSVTE